MAYHIESSIKEGKIYHATVDGKYPYTLDYSKTSYEPIGTTPGGVLFVALGGCKAMVARTYIQKTSEEGEVKVRVKGQFNENVKEGSVQIVAEVDMDIYAPIPEEEREAFESFIDRYCTVGNALNIGNNEITTRYHYHA